MLSATYRIDFPKKEDWNLGTGGRSTFCPVTGILVLKKLVLGPTFSAKILVLGPIFSEKIGPTLKILVPYIS